MAKRFIPNYLIEAKVDFPFIILQRQLNGLVSYIRPDIKDKVTKLDELEFINYIHDNWPITYLDKFEDAYNQYFQIVLNRDGSWYKHELPEDHFTFKEIHEYNKKLDDQLELESQSLHERVRPKVDELFEQNKEKRKIWK